MFCKHKYPIINQDITRALDWSNVCNMSVYIRGQTISARASTFHHFKIFYKSNIKRQLVSIYCDINTLEVVENSISQILMPRVPLKLLSSNITLKYRLTCFYECVGYFVFRKTLYCNVFIRLFLCAKNSG
jgi:hypothetical protein